MARIRNLIIAAAAILIIRSEEHTSELQSRSDLVCRLLLEKKNPLPTAGGGPAGGRGGRPPPPPRRPACLSGMRSRPGRGRGARSVTAAVNGGTASGAPTHL